MAEAMTEGLSGTEIIDDVLAQIKRKLLTSCNLRDSDNYGQGYSAEIKISMKMYAMDATPDEFTVNIAPKGLPPVSTEEVIVTPFDVAEDLTIPQELDLEAVRERIKEPAPLPPASEEEENRMPARLKRKYTKRTGVASLEQPAMGGAVDLDSDEVKF
jgi:hypothetical protein